MFYAGLWVGKPSDSCQPVQASSCNYIGAVASNQQSGLYRSGRVRATSETVLDVGVHQARSSTSTQVFTFGGVKGGNNKVGR